MCVARLADALSLIWRSAKIADKVDRRGEESFAYGARDWYSSIDERG